MFTFLTLGSSHSPQVNRFFNSDILLHRAEMET